MAKKFTDDNVVSVSEEIYFKRITTEDHELLYNLMKRIYPPAYHHFWNDKGSWYVNGLYNLENIKKELSESNSFYSLVYFQEQLIGIIRLVYDLDVDYKENSNYIKLHRLYLDQSIQNKGIGSQIMTWLIEHSKEKGYTHLWLEAMEKKPQALHFYQKLDFEIIDKVLLDFPLLIDEYRGMFKMIKSLV